MRRQRSSSPRYFALTTLAWSVLILGLTKSLQAAETWHISQIKHVYPLGNGDLVLVFKTDAPSCLGTGPGKYHYVSLGENGVTAEGLKNILATSLTAAAMGITISIAFDNATSGCYVNRVFAQF